MGALDFSSREKGPVRPLEEEGSGTTQKGDERVGTPDEEKDRPSKGPKTLERGALPASPASSQGIEGPFGYQLPPFQWSPRELSVLVDSRCGDFKSPITREATVPYRGCLGKVSMKVTVWTYYQA